MSDLTVLLRALAVAARQSDATVTADLIATAQEQGVAKLLYDLQFEDGDDHLPAPTGQLLLNIARQETAIELARMIGIRQVLDCLADADVPVLLLKGSALAYWLYDNPAQRSRCDLDILVRDMTCAKRAISALEYVGYKLSIEGADDSAEFEVALDRKMPGGMLHRVDLHWRLVNHARLADGLNFAELDAGAISIPSLECGARGLGIVHALLHALLHRVTNMPSGQQDRLIWLYDIHLLSLRCSDAEWEEFLLACTTLGCATPCLDGIRAAKRVLNTSMPERAERCLQDCSDQESWKIGSMVDQGEMDRSHLAALSWSQKAGWLRRKLFPSRQFIRHRYGAQGTYAVAKAYVRRWWVGFRRATGGWI